MRKGSEQTTKERHMGAKNVDTGLKKDEQRLFPMKNPTSHAASYTCHSQHHQDRHNHSKQPQPQPPQHRNHPTRSQTPPQDYQQLILNQLRFLRLLLLLVVLHQAGALGCRISEFTCSNYECVPTDAYCDGVPDCADRSDEPRDCSRFLNRKKGLSRQTYMSSNTAKVYSAKGPPSLPASQHPNLSASQHPTSILAYPHPAFISRFHFPIAKQFPSSYRLVAITTPGKATDQSLFARKSGWHGD
ncbi:uncharacterized protein LOC122254338 [Penaeus japonicus]|uniref:uncharacterized protein LOC122254338 n=1 Tax=Penaeus japonicus TaxID=27405 RepID=UPI001C71638C|nr:uncharacterized protein LOC122254338 [Penaeus japonicus]